MIWLQKEIRICRKTRGFHLITHDILETFTEIEHFSKGILHIFIKHTSASITLNENADSTVRSDFEAHFNEMVPENKPYYRHSMEGTDDMPAHLKSSILGSSITIPISDGKLNLGTWQGIYLCEHRNKKPTRKFVMTINGQ